MPRPTKRRSVLAMPCCSRFAPASGEGERAAGGPVVLSVDEYESLRLIDLEGLSQEECVGRMQIARTTVQAIYERARANSLDRKSVV